MSGLIHVCTGTYVEVGTTNCFYGCKVFRCAECGHEKVVHLDRCENA